MDEQMQMSNTPIKSNNELQDTTCSGAFNKQNGPENAPVRKSNPFALAHISKGTEAPIDAELDFDRRSAGERFQTYQTGRKKLGTTSAYHEFMKVNDLFSGTGIKMVRRNSCSKSQSHSRVRGLVVSKHVVKDQKGGDVSHHSTSFLPWTLGRLNSRDAIGQQPTNENQADLQKQLKELKLSDDNKLTKEQTMTGPVNINSMNSQQLQADDSADQQPSSAIMQKGGK
jgi:hypothetical protein